MTMEIKELIEELEGVISCNLIDTGTKGIEEVHIIADKKRDPKRIVRDVETVCLVNSNFKIDHKKISIAQIEQQTTADFSNLQETRIELISIYLENNRSCCNIKMLFNQQELVASYTANRGEPQEKLIARSVLETINNYLSFEGYLVAEDVFTINGKEDLVIAQVNNYDANNQLLEKLVGAVYLSTDKTTAIAKACLKAINRKFTI